MVYSYMVYSLDSIRVFFSVTGLVCLVSYIYVKLSARATYSMISLSWNTVYFLFYCLPLIGQKKKQRLLHALQSSNFLKLKKQKNWKKFGHLLFLFKPWIM